FLSRLPRIIVTVRCLADRSTESSVWARCCRLCSIGATALPTSGLHGGLWLSCRQDPHRDQTCHDPRAFTLHMHTGIGPAKQTFRVSDLGGTESPSLMERSEYDKLDRVEDQMWWFAAGHRNLLMLSQHRVSLEANDRRRTTTSDPRRGRACHIQ